MEDNIQIDQSTEVVNNLAMEIEICAECMEGEVVPQGRCKRCVICGWSPICTM